jgi:hypothetical protein
MAITAKGYPFPATADANDVPADMQALAEKVDTRPGVSALTTAARDALAGAELWDGRVIYNLTAARLERYNATVLAWQPAGITGHGQLTGLANDDHPQYLLHTEGDATYLAKAGGALTGPLSIGTGGEIVPRTSDRAVTDKPSTYPFGLSHFGVFLSNETGYPARGTVLTVRHSSARAFQELAEASGSALRGRRWFRHGYTSADVDEWGPWQLYALGRNLVTAIASQGSAGNFGASTTVTTAATLSIPPEWLTYRLFWQFNSRLLLDAGTVNRTVNISASFDGALVAFGTQNDWILRPGDRLFPTFITHSPLAPDTHSVTGDRQVSVTMTASALDSNLVHDNQILNVLAVRLS